MDFELLAAELESRIRKEVSVSDGRLGPVIPVWMCGLGLDHSGRFLSVGL